MNIGERIKMLRKQNNINQAQLASALREFYGLGTDRVAISKWETGFQLPNIEAVRCIADYFKVSSDFFIKDDINEQNVIPLYRNYPSYNCDGCIKCDGDASFCVVAPDDSMIGAGIKKGANVFVSKTNDISDGTIVVATANNKMYIRRFYQKGDMILLVADNNAFEPVVIDKNQVEIPGKVTSVYLAIE